MSGYTKLFSSILQSSVWQESQPVRIVWIAMLAMADQDGVVEASIPGLAKTAGVDRSDTERALALFMAPDPDSRTKSHDGRRIAEVPGGWFILNHPEYRAKATAEEYRAKAAARQKRARERKAAVTSQVTDNVTRSVTSRSVTPSHAQSRQAEADTEAQADTTPRVPSAPVVDESLRFPDPDAENFSRRDLERVVSDVRGSEWRVDAAPWEVKRANTAAALIMAEAAKRKCSPHDLARRAFLGWAESQKSVDVMEWCKNWNVALPAAAQPRRIPKEM